MQAPKSSLVSFHAHRSSLPLAAQIEKLSLSEKGTAPVARATGDGLWSLPPRHVRRRDPGAGPQNRGEYRR